MKVIDFIIKGRSYDLYLYTEEVEEVKIKDLLIKLSFNWSSRDRKCYDSVMNDLLKNKTIDISFSIYERESVKRFLIDTDKGKIQEIDMLSNPTWKLLAEF